MSMALSRRRRLQERGISAATIERVHRFALARSYRSTLSYDAAWSWCLEQVGRGRLDAALRAATRDPYIPLHLLSCALDVCEKMVRETPVDRGDFRKQWDKPESRS